MGARNLIILTGGLTGSSVLTGLLAKAGYWVGEQTFKKADYDTNENEELVRLNTSLLKAVDYSDYTRRFSAEAVARIAALHGKVDDAPFREFLAVCNQHSPWIWKDPRLWVTIRFWSRIVDLRECQFIMLTRDRMQGWISALLRRQIQTYDYHTRYNDSIDQSLQRFFDQTKLPCLGIQYETLVLEPESTLQQLNAYLGTSLTMDDLRAVYRGALYRRPRGTGDFLKAVAIYVKNYRERMK